MKKRIPFIVLLAIILVLSLTIAILPHSTQSRVKAYTMPSAYTGNSVGFAASSAGEAGKGYAVDTKLTAAPKTFEAFIKLNAETNLSSKRWGKIMGNYYGNSEPHCDSFVIEVQSDKTLRFYWYNPILYAEDGFDYKTTTTLSTDTWMHIAFVRDTANNKTHLYLNGELKESYANAGKDIIPGTVSGSNCGNIKIGMDSRNNAVVTEAFQGSMAYVSISSSVKTQTQLKQNMSNMAEAKATKGTSDMLFVNYAGLNYSGESTDFVLERPYVTNQNLTGVPRTFEALIKVNKNSNLSNGYGVVMGNYYDNKTANDDCFDIIISADGNPRLYWYNSYSGTKNSAGEKVGFNWVVSSVTVNTEKWTHIAFVRDTTNDKTYFYVNGNLADTYADGGDDMIPGAVSTNCGPISIGMDSRPNSMVTQNFQGNIAYTSLSSTIKTSTQIKDSMNKMLNGTITESENDTAFDTVVYNADRSYYRASKDFTATPNTITATIKIPKNYSMTKGGCIIGNYADGASNQSFNLEVLSNGHLYLVWNKPKYHANYSNAEIKYEFTSTDLRNGEWTNIALVRDTSANAFKLYINGVLKESSTGGVGASIIGTYAPVLGNDSRSDGDERNLFIGYIKDCAVFSTALTQSQVSAFYNTADKTKVSKSNYSSMMINWVLTESQRALFYVSGDRKPVTDYSGNDNHAGLCTLQHYYDVPAKDSDGDEWFTAKDGEYTMIIMPDTQCTVRYDIDYYEKNPMVKTVADLDMTKTFQWMVDNKDAMNLSFVMHMGDLKQSRGVSNDWSWGPAYQNDWREWQLISGYTSINPSFQTGATMPANVGFSSSFINGQDYGFGLLRANGIPYSTVIGNHDYNDFNMTEGSGRNADYYNYYFSSAMYDSAFPTTVVARYNNNTTEFAKNNNTNLNVIYEMDATPKGSSVPVKYLVVALEYGPDDDMIAWANSVLSQPKYASHRIILNTHALMYSDGEFMGTHSYCNPADYGWAKTAGVIGANNGQQVYDKLISKHSNSFMALGGHINEESLKSRTDVTTFGNTVYSMLVDLQAMYNSGGDSVLVVAKVNENTKKITFRLYNPVTNKFYNVENEMEYDFSTWSADSSTVNYNTNGGTVSSTSKTVTYGSAYGELATPTKTGYTFNGWKLNDYNVFSKSWTAGSSNSWTYVMQNTLTPGATYNISIDKVEFTAGTATTFDIYIYDASLTTNYLLANINLKAGSNVTGKITCPATANRGTTSLVVYAGTRGATSGNAIAITNFKISTDVNSSTIVFAQNNHTLTASWTLNSYTIKFNANGGSGTMSNLAMTYGTAKNLTANAFTRTGYTFVGWSTSSTATSATYTDKQSVNNLTATADGTVNLYAIWKVNTYTVTWKNHDGTILKTDSVEYGKTPSYTGTTPTKVGDEHYSYTFKAWSPEIEEVTKDVVYTATYNTIVNEYTVTWKNWDGSVIKTDSVKYGRTPGFVGNEPTRPSTQEYTYTFAGWSTSAEGTALTELPVVTGDITYYAVYTQTEIVKPSSSSSSSVVNSSSNVTSSSSVVNSSCSSSSSSSSITTSSSIENSSSINSSDSSINSSSEITSNNTQNSQSTAEIKPARGGCSSNIGTNSIVVFGLIALFACGLIIKKSKIKF